MTSAFEFSSEEFFHDLIRHRACRAPVGHHEAVKTPRRAQGIQQQVTGFLLDIGGLYLEDYSDMMDCDLVKQIGLIDEELLAKDTTKATLHVYLPENVSVEEASAYIEERFTSEDIKYVFKTMHLLAHAKKGREEEFFKRTYTISMLNKMVIDPNNDFKYDKNVVANSKQEKQNKKITKRF